MRNIFFRLINIEYGYMIAATTAAYRIINKCDYFTHFSFFLLVHKTITQSFIHPNNLCSATHFGLATFDKQTNNVRNFFPLPGWKPAQKHTTWDYLHQIKGNHTYSYLIHVYIRFYFSLGNVFIWNGSWFKNRHFQKAENVVEHETSMERLCMVSLCSALSITKKQLSNQLSLTMTPT